MCPVSALRVPLLPRADEPLSPPRRRWMGTRSSVAFKFLCKEDRYNVVDVKEVGLSVIESAPDL
uniref:Uncharacterized protein n=1 Tax=Oryza nivara TaxID=4536 RepID=A0A0E0J9J0_ORYNI